MKRELTATPRTFGEEEPKQIKQYKVRRGRFCVPIEWGIERFPKAKLIDRTPEPAKVKFPKTPSPDHPKAPKGQAKFMEDVLAAVLDNFAVLGIAPTGKGKTVVALWLAAVLGVRVLVITPNTEIMENWIAEAKEHVGVDAGVVRQDKCEWKNKKVVVSIIHSLAGRDYGPEFYEGFGLVVWDEAHVTGAFTFSQTLGMFNARYKLALTATARRKDGAECLFFNYFGPGYAKQYDKALPADCYTVNVKHEPRKWPKALSIILNILTASPHRNRLLAKWVKWLYARDREILGLSDRISQLETVRDLLVKEFGIPAEDIGIVANQKTVRMDTVYKPIKKAFPGKSYFVNAYLLGWTRVRVKMRTGKKYLIESVEGEDIQPVTLDKLHTGPHIVPVRAQMTKEEIAEAKKKRIILATYGKFSMGANVPRLDAGIDLSPRATGEQQIGRIRRYVKGKPRPLWITPIDKGIALCEGFADARIEEYRRSNVKVTPYAKIKNKLAA